MLSLSTLFSCLFYLNHHVHLPLRLFVLLPPLLSRFLFFNLLTISPPLPPPLCSLNFCRSSCPFPSSPNSRLPSFSQSSFLILSSNLIFLISHPRFLFAFSSLIFLFSCLPLFKFALPLAVTLFLLPRLLHHVSSPFPSSNHFPPPLLFHIDRRGMHFAKTLANESLMLLLRFQWRKGSRM